MRKYRLFSKKDCLGADAACETAAGPGNKGRIRAAGVILLLLFGFLCARLLFVRPPEERACQENSVNSCQIWYLLNVDGMGGLGHSALLLVDELGGGRIYSYNGMEYNLFWCLLGKEGVGFMREISLDPEERAVFCQSGQLSLSDSAECRDFDRALYREITREEYGTVYQAVQKWIEKEQLWDLLEQEDIPLYHIYTHNCDTAARELIALVDEEVEEYNQSHARLTPGGNFREMCRRLGSGWGIRRLGEDSWKERLLERFLGV
ncbi:MAG: hypothetical protein HFI31_07555 [Lachnospiraceae bacterium]|jgi:hypothetical protein|nr:hypothetical protein [Lachnospiraceae bacterium]MCI9134026.1 hypothetical protein [Lachnospiraceae bacterium]